MRPFCAHAFLDWDDTLKINHPLYVEASRANGRRLARIFTPFGETLEGILAAAHELDLAKVQVAGLSVDRFPEAWADTYKLLCRKYELPVDEELCEELWREAAGVLERPQPDVPGAAETLNWLRQYGYEVNVWTAGVEAAQQGKVARSGLRHLIDNVYVVPLKTKEALRQAIAHRPLDRCFVVGNSPRSDILPALQLGVTAVHIPCQTWAFDEAVLETGNRHYYRLEEISTLPELVRHLFERVSYGG